MDDKSPKDIKKALEKSKQEHIKEAEKYSLKFVRTFEDDVKAAGGIANLPQKEKVAEEKKIVEKKSTPKNPEPVIKEKEIEEDDGEEEKEVVHKTEEPEEEPELKRELEKPLPKKLKFAPQPPQRKPEQPDKNRKGFEAAKKHSLNVLRTYEDDIKLAVRDKDMTTAKLVIAEQRRKAATEKIKVATNPKSTKNILITTLSIFIILAGIGVTGYFYFQNSKLQNPNTETIVKTRTLLESESATEIDTSGKDNRQLVDDIAFAIGAPTKEDTFHEILLAKWITTTDEETEKEILEKELLISEEFFTILQARAPEAFIRSVEPTFMIGAHNTGNENHPFIIFKINDFNLSYGNIFAWESTMASDLEDIFYQTLKAPEPIIIPVVETASSTASTTETIASTTPEIETPQIPKFDPKNFVDQIIKNKDTRAIINEEGKVLFFYSFVDRETLVITSNVATFEEIILRLRTVRLVR